MIFKQFSDMNNEEDNLKAGDFVPMDQHIMQDQLLASFKQKKSSSGVKSDNGPKLSDICLVCNLKDLF